MKVQTNIALLFSALVTAIIVMLSFVVYYITNQNLYEDFYKRLNYTTTSDVFTEVGIPHVVMEKTRKNAL